MPSRKRHFLTGSDDHGGKLPRWEGKQYTLTQLLEQTGLTESNSVHNLGEHVYYYEDDTKPRQDKMLISNSGTSEWMVWIA
jgi:hypothetical protein